MLLIIVGAGASFDSDWRRIGDLGLHPESTLAQQMALGSRPPLAADLFNEQRFGRYVAKYPPSQGLMVRLRKAAPAVEQELERIREESKEQEHLPRQILGVRYYLRELIEQTVEQWVSRSGAGDRLTNFTRLLGRLEPWRQHSQKSVLIVTFNYDTLFEEALINSLPRLQMRAMEDYIADGRYKLFKLHGSVDWWREVTADTSLFPSGVIPAVRWAATMFDPPVPFKEDGPFRVGANNLSNPCVPMLALPMATKGSADFACPSDHLDQLKGSLREVTDVLIIGWRGAEQHFLRMWRDVHATRPDRRIHSLAVVDKTEADAHVVLTNIMQEVGLTVNTMAARPYETFSDFVDKKLDEYVGQVLSS